MTNNKQQTAVDSIIELCQELLANHYSISHDGVCSEIIRFCQEQAKEMEEERMIEFAYNALKIADNTTNRYVDVDELYKELYGEGDK
jgi:hypothetical protein